MVGVIHARNTTKKKGTSWESSSEAETVVALAKALTKTPPKGYPPGKILALTPYEAQLQLINALLRKQQVTGIRTSTIEKSQGSESEVTIISPVKLDAPFATDKLRVNVALTRACTQLFVVAEKEEKEKHRRAGEEGIALEEKKRRRRRRTSNRGKRGEAQEGRRRRDSTRGKEEEEEKSQKQKGEVQEGRRRGDS